MCFIDSQLQEVFWQGENLTFQLKRKGILVAKKNLKLQIKYNVKVQKPENKWILLYLPPPIVVIKSKLAKHPLPIIILFLHPSV